MASHCGMDGRVSELGAGREVSFENVPGVRNAHSSCHSLTELPKQEADQEANQTYLLHVLLYIYGEK